MKCGRVCGACGHEQRGVQECVHGVKCESEWCEV